MRLLIGGGTSFDATPRTAEDARREVLHSFAVAVEKHGGKSLARYFDMVDHNQQALLDTVASTAPQLGWGVWQFFLDENSLRLEVTNSPYVTFEASGSGDISCAPILGMFTALAKMIFRAPTSQESICSKELNGTCVFLAQETGA